MGPEVSVGLGWRASPAGFRGPPAGSAEPESPAAEALAEIVKQLMERAGGKTIPLPVVAG